MTEKSRKFCKPGLPRPGAGGVGEIGLERISAVISPVKPKSPADPTEYVDHDIHGAGASSRRPGLVQLVADRVKTRDGESDSELARSRPGMGFLKKSPQHEYGENEILTKMTELSNEEMKQLDYSGGQSRKQKA